MLTSTSSFSCKIEIAPTQFIRTVPQHISRMPFKKPNNSKNKTKKQQKKKAASSAKPADDASSVEEIVITEESNPSVATAPIEEVEVEKIPTEEELAEIAAHERYMWETYYRPQMEENRKRWQDAQIAMLNDPEYWEHRIANLERSRQKFHTKAAWSPETFHEVNSIDHEIEHCEDMLDMLDGVEPELPTGNPILGGMDWWKDGLQGDDEDGWVSSK